MGFAQSTQHQPQRNKRTVEFDRGLSGGPSPASPRCPERLMTKDCAMVQLGDEEIFVQEKAAISNALAKQVSQKSFPLAVKLRSEQQKEYCLVHAVRAQAGLIQTGARSQGGLAWLVTAKHILFDKEVNETVYGHDPTKSSFLALDALIEVRVQFPKVKTPPGSKNEQMFYGWDAVWGSEPFHRSDQAFRMAPRSFKPVVGMKVGICASHERPITLDDLETKFDSPEMKETVKNLSPQALERIFGPTQTPNIYTGEITGVEAGGKLIVHNINCFGGCAGAVVFLLDQQQPDSVRPKDYGKAIAIHCGSKESGNCASLLGGFGRPHVFKWRVRSSWAKFTFYIHPYSVESKRRGRRCDCSSKPPRTSEQDQRNLDTTL